MDRDGYKKHRAVIQAWSNGADVECLQLDGTWLCITDDGATPNWNANKEFRVARHDVKWAAAKLMEGKSVRRNSWGEGVYACGTAIQFAIGNISHRMNLKLDAHDILADDWELS